MKDLGQRPWIALPAAFALVFVAACAGKSGDATAPQTTRLTSTPSTISDDAPTEPLTANAVFAGELNGIHLYSFDDVASGVESWPSLCSSGAARTEPRDADELTFRYLPPGAVTLGGQTAVVCEDGRVASFGQQFSAGGGTFDIWYAAGERTLGHDAPAERISAEEINGMEAVVIRPGDGLLPRGWIAMVTPGGLLTLDARGLPLEEMVRIAEGIGCSTC